MAEQTPQLARPSLPNSDINHMLVVYGNIIVLVVLVTTCTCCYARKKTRPIPFQEASGEDFEKGNDGKMWGEVESSNNFQLPRLLIEHLNLHALLHKFKRTEVQPAYQELVPFALPDTIPEPPSGLTEDLGTLYFSVSYDDVIMALQVHVHKASKLPAKDLIGTVDPYVRVSLHPSPGSNRLETRTRMRNANPVWNEMLMFEELPSNKLLKKSLILKVFDYDRFSRDEEVGEVEMILGNLNLQPDPIEFIEPLRPCQHSKGYHRGDLLVSLLYQSSSSSLIVIVMKGSRLQPGNTNRTPHLYVKVCLHYDGRKVDRRVTRVQKGTVDPVWNQVIEFTIPVERIGATSLCFHVKEYEEVFPNKLIGKCTLGNQCAGSALRHWTSMLNDSRHSVAMWHTIVK